MGDSKNAALDLEISFVIQGKIFAILWSTWWV